MALTKTPKSRLRSRLRSQGFSKKQAFRVTRNLSAGPRRRRKQMGNLRHFGTGRRKTVKMAHHVVQHQKKNVPFGGAGRIRRRRLYSKMR